MRFVSPSVRPGRVPPPPITNHYHRRRRAVPAVGAAGDLPARGEAAARVGGRLPVLLHGGGAGGEEEAGRGGGEAPAVRPHLAGRGPRRGAEADGRGRALHGAVQGDPGEARGDRRHGPRAGGVGRGRHGGRLHLAALLGHPRLQFLRRGWVSVFYTCIQSGARMHSIACMYVCIAHPPISSIYTSIKT